MRQNKKIKKSRTQKSVDVQLVAASSRQKYLHEQYFFVMQGDKSSQVLIFIAGKKD